LQPYPKSTTYGTPIFNIIHHPLEGQFTAVSAIPYSGTMPAAGWRLRFLRCLVAPTMVKPLQIFRFAGAENRAGFLVGYLSPAVPASG
jgi:hypothetical protein